MRITLTGMAAVYASKSTEWSPYLQVFSVKSVEYVMLREGLQQAESKMWSCPAGFEMKNDCADEAQQQFTSESDRRKSLH
jgi:hypothetical protein